MSYEAWRDTCDTVHAHTQVLGKLAMALAPPEPQLLHAALRFAAHGWETQPLSAPDVSGALVVALDLHAHDAVVEHSDGRTHRVPLVPDRPVAEVTRELLAAVEGLVGAVPIDPRPQETPWSTPLDEDFDHARYDPATPPSNDFIMRNAANAQQIEIGWWRGDHRYSHAACFAFAFRRAVTAHFASALQVWESDASTTSQSLVWRALPRMGAVSSRDHVNDRGELN